MKIVSWNVNGLRAVIKKDFDTIFRELNADAFCLQETKAQDDQVQKALAPFSDHHIYCNSAEKKGYSGTAVIARKEPLQFFKTLGKEEHDQEGRISGLEYEDFYLINVYVPNSGSELKRLDYRQEWDTYLLDYLKRLEDKKPVILCGDMNVCHRDIDIARPKANYNKSAGYMQEEIDGMDNFIKAGFVDAYRHFYPDQEGAYTWWSYRANARGNNVGWRLDYFLVSEALLPKIEDITIHNDIMGSDHCPVSIILK